MTVSITAGSSIRVGEMYSHLKHSMQIKNISGRGFCVFYGDETKREILLLDTGGKLVEKKKVVPDVPFYVMQTSGSNIYLLTKIAGVPWEGNYKLYTYFAGDSTKEYLFRPAR